MHTGTVLITGAGRGLGLEFARQYAADGWRVIACCRSPKDAQELKNLGRPVEVHALDVTSQESIDHLAQALKGVPIDVLINNAGVHGDRRPFGETDVALWQKIFAVNTIAPYQILAALLENVAASTQKKAVNITSKVGSIGEGPSGGTYAYRSSKTALNMVMVNAAHELRNHGITILLIHPGWVQTDMGGSSAPVTIEQSIAGVRRIIDKATPAESGHFYDYTGRQIPW
ncbi:MAG TPA: SDR family oxidoreductase [Dongiaceae bacterium]|jgi:NAD(P)-dependent dehydrogenase (short-subunit alcohol dehydrogenase family)|nr:SDR family oxidoreductase [Dongiaceae bacterium]